MSCVYNFLGYVTNVFVLHKIFGVLCSRAQEPLVLMKSGKSTKIKNKNTKALEVVVGHHLFVHVVVQDAQEVHHICLL